MQPKGYLPGIYILVLVTLAASQSREQDYIIYDKFPDDFKWGFAVIIF